MSKVLIKYVDFSTDAHCRLVTSYPNGPAGHVSYAYGILNYSPGGLQGDGRLPGGPKLRGKLSWHFSDRSWQGAAPFDPTRTEPLELALFNGPDPHEIGNLFNPNWRNEFPRGIGLRLIHEEEDPYNKRDLLIGLDGNGAGFIISLFSMYR